MSFWQVQLNRDNLHAHALADISISPKAATSTSVNVEITVTSTVAAFLLSSLVFFIAGALCMRLFQSKPIEDQSEAALDTAVPAIQSQSVPIYESLHVSMPTGDYDLKENAAYGHIVVQQ